MKKLIFICTTLTLVLSCLSCQQVTLGPPLLRFGYAVCDHHAPLYIAAMNPDHFKKTGPYLQQIIFKKEYELVDRGRILARVFVSSSNGGKQLVRELNENIFDMSFATLPAMLKFIDQGNNLKIMAPAGSAGAGLTMAGRLSIDSWDDFVTYTRQSGRIMRIGYNYAFSSQELIIEAALRNDDVSFSKDLDDETSKVILINLHGAGNLVPAFEAGIIDGFVAVQPSAAKAEHLGLGKTIDYLGALPTGGRRQSRPCCVLGVNGGYLLDQPEVVRAMTNLLGRAALFLKRRPQESARQVARWLGTAPVVEEASMSTTIYNDSFDESWTEGLQWWLKTMVADGTLDALVKEAMDDSKLDALLYSRQLRPGAWAEQGVR